jgi:hydrogenase-4 component B
MGVLAVRCVILGLGAPRVISGLYQILGSFTPIAVAAPTLAESHTWLLAPGGLAQVSPLLLTFSLVSVVIVAFAAIRARGLKLRYADTWGCGRIGQTARMEYTSSAFAEPLRRIFSELYQPTEDLSISAHPQSRYFVHAISYRSQVTPWVEKMVYDPILDGIQKLARQVRRVQAGSVHLYLLYMAAALLLALTFAWWFL